MLPICPVAIPCQALNSELTPAGQDAAIADGAAQFVLWALPSIPSMTVGQCTARYLMMQGYVFPTSVRPTDMQNPLCQVDTKCKGVESEGLSFPRGMPCCMGGAP